MKQIAIINGANLNLLGERQPEIYGADTLEQINAELEQLARKHGVELILHQTNSEGEMVDLVQAYRRNVIGIIINPGGFSHTSVALLDALLAVEAPVVEVHLSNLHRREEFRRTSITAQGAVGVICGFGKHGYKLAVQYLIDGDGAK